MKFIVLLALLCSAALVFAGKTPTCAQLTNGSDLPCYEVPHCDVDAPIQPLIINKLSNGLGPSVSTSEIYLCHDELNLKVSFTGKDQKFLYNPGYKNCNDAIFNNDVFEFFVSPYVSQTAPHCYNELDISPYSVMFQSGIYNPNLNHSGIQGNDFDCASSGIDFSTKIHQKKDLWTAELTFPFSLLNCPFKCPVVEEQEFCNKPEHVGVYYANFYRINELSLVTSCSSSTCEYNAWSPTLSNPPAFHEPTRFGFLVMKD